MLIHWNNPLELNNFDDDKDDDDNDEEGDGYVCFKSDLQYVQ